MSLDNVHSQALVEVSKCSSEILIWGSDQVPSPRRLFGGLPMRDSVPALALEFATTSGTQLNYSFHPISSPNHATGIRIRQFAS